MMWPRRSGCSQSDHWRFCHQSWLARSRNCDASDLAKLHELHLARVRGSMRGHAACSKMAMSTDHRKLSAFMIADEFAVRVYTATRAFPVEERYGLRSQIRRAAVSAPANIVEGCARDSDREHARFFEIAFGSTREAIYLIDLASSTRTSRSRCGSGTDPVRWPSGSSACSLEAHHQVIQPQDLKASRPQASRPQDLKTSRPQDLKPSSPQALKP